MTGVGFLILLGLNCLLLPCKGAITSPPDGTKYVFLPGETAKIKWKFNDTIPSLYIKAWYFTSRSRDFSPTIPLASIFRDDPTKIHIQTDFYEVDIERPSTLVLKNVNQSYNGEYLFELYNQANRTFSFEVTVYIAKKPTVTLNCSNATLSKGDDFTCECEGQGGNPPANVTWYKDGNQMQGKTGTEKQLLTLINIDETDSGTYKCVAESYPDPLYKDEKSIRLNVRWSKLITTTQKPSIPNASEKSSGTVVVWHIVVSLLSGIIIGILFSYIVSCSRRRWCRNKKFERNFKPQTEGVDTTYQELDLTKMNTEDNYQSLRGNVAVRASNDAANDDDSTYTQLSKTRDVEDNYQSLT